MDGLIVNSISLKLVKIEGVHAVYVKDLTNKHQAVLKLNARGKLYVIESTFPPYGKRNYEMLYIAEVNKERVFNEE